jgi:hypothetical protein
MHKQSGLKFSFIRLEIIQSLIEVILGNIIFLINSTSYSVFVIFDKTELLEFYLVIFCNYADLLPSSKIDSLWSFGSRKEPKGLASPVEK